MHHVRELVSGAWLTVQYDHQAGAWNVDGLVVHQVVPDATGAAVGLVGEGQVWWIGATRYWSLLGGNAIA